MRILLRLCATVSATVLAVALVGVAPNPARAAALPTPATPVAGAVTTTSIAMTWAASSGPVRSYTVQRFVSPTYVDVATTISTAYTATGLTPDTVYIHRLVANPLPGSGATASQPSGLLYVTTAPLPDSVPPTTPSAAPIMTGISIMSATVNSGGSTDNNRVATFIAQLLVGGTWVDAASNNITVVYLRDLSPATTYTVATVAVDPNGNRSARSAPTTFTTRALAPAPACTVQLITFNLGYLAYLTVENMTLGTLVDWTVTFTLPADHAVSPAFNGTVARAGTVGTFTPAVYVRSLGPGGGVTVGFNGSYPATSVLPSGFALNGTTPCSLR